MSSPTLVSDTFHFSSYYWRESYVNLEDISDGDPEVQPDQDSSSVSSTENLDNAEISPRISKVRTTSVGSSDEVMKPTPVQPNSDRIKLKFYAHVLGDGTENIHFGKWDGIDMENPGAYGKASEAMTNYMYNLSMGLLPHRAEASDLKCVDLGSGTGASAIHLAERHSKTISEAVCLNLCHKQNMTAEERAAQKGLSDVVKTIDSPFEETPCESNYFDLAFSQDAFVHSLSKLVTFTEAYRITKPGGAFVFCDLMCGDNPDLTAQELAEFASRNRINDWLTPQQVVRTCELAGWKDVKFVDLTTDLRISFHLMLKKVTFILEHGDMGYGAPNQKNRVLLMNYRDSICHRITQIDRGVFKWGVIHSRKPVCMELACKPPVPFNKTNHLILQNKGGFQEAEEKNKEQETASNTKEVNVLVVDILQKINKEKIESLPSTIKLLITMSAGLDHIDLKACASRGIVVKQSGRDAITSHVVQYTLSFLILGLRDALNQLGVPFPSSGWNLNWNCDGKPLTNATIAIVGMGIIAKTLVEEIRKLAPDTRIVYHVPPTMREFDAESKLNLEYMTDLKELAQVCDVLVPLCPLTKHTEHLINQDVIANLKPEAGLINMSRGKVVDTDALTSALESKSIKYAILDTTFPEPLPSTHALWSMDNCYIFPHYATNTMAVREALVNEIQPIIEDHFGLGHSDERRKAEEKTLRYDLAIAHRLTVEYGMDMLVWNHISARFRTGRLITPGRKMWSKITPEDLVYSSSNDTANVIHDAIYMTRPDVKAIIHLHTPAAVAISCLECGFQPMSQDSAYFYGKVANYEWDGLSADADEAPLIASAVNAVEGCNTLLMHNHGFACFGSSVREAWILAYYFEKCCEVQLRVMQSGGAIRHPSKLVMAQAAKDSYLPEYAPGAQEWEALCDLIPSFN